MRRWFPGAPLARTIVLGAAALAAVASARSNSFVMVDGAFEPAWFICDALRAPEVIAVGRPDAARRALIVRYSKEKRGHYTYHAYDVGRAQAARDGARYSLVRRDGVAEPEDGRSYLGMFDRELLERPGRALTPAVRKVRLRDVDADCRWLSGTRFAGFGQDRSYLITQSRDGLVLRTFEFDAPPGLRLVRADGVQQTTPPSRRVTGGQSSRSGRAVTYTFRGNDRTYTVRVSRSEGQPGASVTESRDGKVIRSEELKGYTLVEGQ